jgi:XTP/dITP diphosphohydrolase
MKLLVATTNRGKLQEIREILAGVALEMVSLADLQLPAPDEPFATFEDNASRKATACASWSGLWTLGDDSGLCVDALGGAPGVFSARFAPTEEERRAKLLRHLEGVPDPRRGAHFICAMVLSSPDGKRIYRAEGRVHGRIAHVARGTNGFGYDPLFLPDEVPRKTLAELEPLEKNRLSHRGRALERLRPLLETLAREGNLAAES